MWTKNLTISFVIALLVTVIAGCDLTEVPKSTTSIDEVFGSENGLELYTNSFYEYLPSADNITRGDAMSDYGATDALNSIDFVIPGAYTAETHNSGWDWGRLRNINYFLQNNTNEEIPADVRAH